MSKPIEIESIKQWNDLWCGPCKAIAPRYNLLASQTPQTQFLRVDVDKQTAIAQQFQVSAMPTFFAIKSQNVVGMLRGADPQGLARLVRQHSGPNPPVPPFESKRRDEHSGSDSSDSEESLNAV
ncbi:thioredoxin-like protein [Mycena rebaudengoi]|nr:thioredoxin-like protein [Mycena rebaudengoi]